MLNVLFPVVPERFHYKTLFSTSSFCEPFFFLFFFPALSFWLSPIFPLFSVVFNLFSFVFCFLNTPVRSSIWSKRGTFGGPTSYYKKKSVGEFHFSSSTFFISVRLFVCLIVFSFFSSFSSCFFLLSLTIVLLKLCCFFVLNTEINSFHFFSRAAFFFRFSSFFCRSFFLYFQLMLSQFFPGYFVLFFHCYSSIFPFVLFMFIRVFSWLGFFFPFYVVFLSLQ